MTERTIFATLAGGPRIWAVPAIHGEAARLSALHAALAERLRVGDRLIYLGNFLGHGAQVRETVDELLLFRRALIATPGAERMDIVYLRGAQEEMWQKLLQLQFASNPPAVLEWMARQGIGPTIEAYGGRLEDGFIAAQEGILTLTRWTSQLRQAMRGMDGHTTLMSVLRHAALTEDNRLLFVSAGLDPARSLDNQGDSFWWDGNGFAQLADHPFDSFSLVIRGFDHRRAGVRMEKFTCTLDSGCGFGGPLIAACFAAGGDVVDYLEV